MENLSHQDLVTCRKLACRLGDVVISATILKKLIDEIDKLKQDRSIALDAIKAERDMWRGRALIWEDNPVSDMGE